MKKDYSRFKSIDFEGFRCMASDPSLSPYEKIGFPDDYREGYGAAILGDISHKLPALDLTGKKVLDIGPGCSDLALLFIEKCEKQNHHLYLADSREMLSHLPDLPFIEKVNGRFPEDCSTFVENHHGQLDIILCYSVFHYIFRESSIFRFLDTALGLLNEGGRLLIGDVPNISKRKRFFVSNNGIRYHQTYTGTEDIPEIHFNRVETEEIDDSVLVALLLRCRQAGFDAFLLPQPEHLPMANRREDLLIVRP
jgi:hypothetical protein